MDDICRLGMHKKMENIPQSLSDWTVYNECQFDSVMFSQYGAIVEEL